MLLLVTYSTNETPSSIVFVCVCVCALDVWLCVCTKGFSPVSSTPRDDPILFFSNRFTYIHITENQTILPKIHFNVELFTISVNVHSSISSLIFSIVAFVVSHSIRLLLLPLHVFMSIFVSFVPILIPVRFSISLSLCLYVGGLKQQILTRAVSRHFGMRLAIYNELYSKQNAKWRSKRNSHSNQPHLASIHHSGVKS